MDGQALHSRPRFLPLPYKTLPGVVVALNLLDDQIRALARKLPTLYRRRTLVLLGFLALHLFIVTPFVRLSTDEQRYQKEAASMASRIKHLGAVENDIRRVLNQIDRQKALLRDDLVARFKELNAARDGLRLPMEDRYRGTPSQSADQLPDGPRPYTEVNTALAEAVAKAENADDKADAYRELIHRLILEPAFTQANQRWQDEKTAIAARLRHIREGLPEDETLQGIEDLLGKIDDEVRRYRFTPPEGDWWMTVSGKEDMLDRNLDRITAKFLAALTPLAAGRNRLNQEIEEKKNQLAQARREKEALAKRAAESFHQLEKSLNIALIDGVQAITFFPALLAAALALMTADIGRCLRELRRCRRQVDSSLQTEIAQWIAIAARPPYLLDFLMALWIFLAVVQVRPLIPDNALYAGQILFGAVILATVAIWEGAPRRRAMAEVAAGQEAQSTDASA